MQKTVSREASFMRYLRQKSQPADLARLRRGLAEVGQQVVPVVEGFLGRIQSEREDGWERTCYYLVAGLWASSVSWSDLKDRSEAEEEEEPTQAEEQPVEAGYRRTLGYAMAQLYLARKQPPSIEGRFVALLDANEEELPYRLRQMVRLLKTEDGIRIHWAELLRDLLAWNRERKPVQQKWARAFYRAVSRETAEEEVKTTPREVKDAY